MDEAKNTVKEANFVMVTSKKSLRLSERQYIILNQKYKTLHLASIQ